MNYAGRVGGIECTRNLNCEFDNLVERQITGADMIPQSAAFNKLRSDKVTAIFPAKVIDRNNVRMIERARGSGLTFQTEYALRTVEARRQEFERGRPPQSRVVSEVNSAH